MSWLSIDAGTSVIKAVLFDTRANELATARATIAVSRPHPGHAEQSMDAVWKAVSATIQQLLAHPAAQHPIEGIVTTAQGDGVWLVDTTGHPTGPAILWNDGRAIGIVERWHAAGTLDQAFRRNGSVTYPGLPNAIWQWLAEHTPDRLHRSRWSLTANGWLHLQLTGKVAANLSDASNPFLDLHTRQYSPELLRLFDAEPHQHLLPPFTETPQAPLRADVAQQFGLTPGIPVLMAPYDIAATATGCGSVHPGDGCVILGTTLCAEVLVSDPQLSRAPAGTTLTLQSTAVDGRPLFLRALPTLTGCEALDWVSATLQLPGVDHLSRLAAEAPPGAANLVFLPYLSPAGERSPFLAPTARGSLLGLSLEHTPAHIARAVFEALSFVIRDCLATATPDSPRRLTVCGGGSRSDLWCQLIADVCGCEVLRPQASEIGARGALLHAFAATSVHPSLAAAVAALPLQTDSFRPNPAQTHIYDPLFGRFLRLREQVAPIWQLMAAPPPSKENAPA